MIVGGRRKHQVVSQNEVEEVVAPKAETTEQLILSYIDGRDYSGAATYIDFIHKELGLPYTKEIRLWHGYSLFHLGQYEDAIEVYQDLLKDEPDDTILYLYIASCQFYIQEYEEARDSANKGPNCDFKTRLLFHIAQQLQDEEQLYQNHSQLVGTLENQLSLAAIHYMRAHYQDAIDLYQKLLSENPDYLALNVYIAMCMYKLEMFEESNEAVDQYLGVNSDSAVALNLKSCDYLVLFDSPTAESQLLQIRKFSSATYGFVDGLIEHNLCVFHDGENGFTILPKLVDVIPEARQNLAILYMREANALEAYNLLQDFEPNEVTDSVLKATVDLAYGQINLDPTPIDKANEVFAEVGKMDVVRDTVPGREALATTNFIQGEYEATLKVLASVESEIGTKDEFNYNKAMSLAALSRWAEAEKYFLMVTNPAYTKEIYYISWLCKCYIMNKEPEKAYELYEEATNTDDAKTLLQIISTDCFNEGQYYYAMKAYDILSKYSPEPFQKEGMIASSVGVFRNILSRKESVDKLPEVLEVLSSDPDAADALQTIQNCLDSGILDTGMM